ncbi:MAG: hypothetical protein ACR2PL_03675, partial [Dehalococcoidia bacterium]
MPEPGPADQAATPGSWIVAERGEVWSVYRPDAPGVNLEQALLRLLILRATGADLLAAPFVCTGLLGLCPQRLGHT